MIHDLYLRAHIAASGDKSGEEQPRKRSRSPKLWPDYALVWDTETTLDLEQMLNFGVWRFCKLQGPKYVAAQEGIFYRDGLAHRDVETILAYQKTNQADGLVSGANTELAVLSQAAFVDKVFWESVRAGALIVGFNLSFDIARIAVRWTPADNGGFSFILSNLNRSRISTVHVSALRLSME